jgi:hypothetical protein
MRLNDSQPIFIFFWFTQFISSSSSVIFSLHLSSPSLPWFRKSHFHIQIFLLWDSPLTSPLKLFTDIGCVCCPVVFAVVNPFLPSARGSPLGPFNKIAVPFAAIVHHSPLWTATIKHSQLKNRQAQFFKDFSIETICVTVRLSNLIFKHFILFWICL